MFVVSLHTLVDTVGVAASVHVSGSDRVET
jgi:hypothetical protein